MNSEWVPKKGVNVVAYDSSGAPGVGVVLKNTPTWEDAEALKLRLEAQGVEVALYGAKPSDPSPRVKAAWDGAAAWLAQRGAKNPKS
jgi:hypothetical protein